MHTPELPLSAEDVEAAARRLGPVLRRTPLELSHRLSELTGVPVWLKREDLQAVRSYKLRGAHLFMDSLDAADREADRKSTRLNSSHVASSYAVLCLKK